MLPFYSWEIPLLLPFSLSCSILQKYISPYSLEIPLFLLFRNIPLSALQSLSFYSSETDLFLHFRNTPLSILQKYLNFYSSEILPFYSSEISLFVLVSIPFVLPISTSLSTYTSLSTLQKYGNSPFLLFRNISLSTLHYTFRFTYQYLSFCS